MKRLSILVLTGFLLFFSSQALFAQKFSPAEIKKIKSVIEVDNGDEFKKYLEKGLKYTFILEEDIMVARYCIKNDALNCLLLLDESEKQILTGKKNASQILLESSIFGAIKVFRHFSEIKGVALEGKSENEDPFFQAACEGQIEICRALLDKGVDINRLIGPYKLTALVAAAWHGQSSTIDMLLKNGADPAVIVKGGNTALQLYVQLKAKQSAMYWENSEKGIKLSVNTQKPETKETLVNITKLLAVPEIINLHNFENEKTALIWAAEWSSLPIVETLIECGAEIDAVDKNGATALIWNAGNSNNDIAIQKTLLENGAEIDKANQSGLTALFVSYANDVQPYRTVTKFLLEQGADPNIYPANGGSMLCWAAVQNNEQDLEIVRILMEHGANPYLRSCSDCGNMDAFDYAKKYGNTKAIQIMESYKVD